jgi:hypothetical protein
MDKPDVFTLLKGDLEEAKQLLLQSRRIPVTDPIARKQIAVLRRAISHQNRVLSTLVGALEKLLTPKTKARKKKAE